MIDKAASVLAKLKNKARISGISYQQCLQLFMQEEFCGNFQNLVMKTILFGKADCLSIRLPILKVGQR